MVWPYVVALVAVMVIAYATMPKPQNTAPPIVDSPEIPTADEGKEIGVLFGTRDIKDPQVVWYGDIRTQPIKKKGGKK